MSCSSPPTLKPPVAPIDVHEVIARDCDVIQAILGPSVRVETSLAQRESRVYARQVDLDRILLNVVRNAAAAMPSGGVLLIETAHLPPRPDDRRCPDAPFGRLRLTLADTGHGVPMRDVSLVRDSTQRPRPDGRGIGLSSVSLILLRLGGRLESSAATTPVPSSRSRCRWRRRPRTGPLIARAARAPIRRIVDTSCRSSFSGALALAAALLSAQEPRPRAREIGLAPGVFEPGPLNAITDVAGVSVGHATLIQGDTIRTGVTVIVPHQGNVFQDKVPGAVFVGNAFGKLAGSTQVDELGTIETPIALTNTLSVGAVMDGLVRWTLDQPGNDSVRSVNALVGETNDGGLNDIRGQHVRPQHVLEALEGREDAERSQEGSVGAGTGTQAFGWKGGIGTSSRKLDARYGGYTVGVLVQSNYGGVLTMGGAPVGKILGRYSYRPTGQQAGGPAGTTITATAPA